MAKKRTGISRDLIIHPGETIADVLEDRGITQSELAARTGVSKTYVSNVISGKKNISLKFAAALEYALDIPKSFWINLQAHYDSELMELNEVDTVTDNEKSVLSDLHEIVNWLRKVGSIPNNQSKEDTVLSLRKIFGMSDIASIGNISTVGAFRMAKKVSVNPVVMGAWLRMCQSICERNNSITPQFDPERVDQLIYELKSAMIGQKRDLQKELSTIMAKYGIKFAMVRNFRGAPVHGYISQNKNGEYQMVLTIRGSFADIFWFSVFHEIGHIVNGDVSKASGFIDVSSNSNAEIEKAADKFAVDSLLDPDSYRHFLNVGNYSIGAIKTFASNQRVAPYIVIGRLQKEGRIPYSRYSGYKVRYKWAE